MSYFTQYNSFIFAHQYNIDKNITHCSICVNHPEQYAVTQKCTYHNDNGPCTAIRWLIVCLTFFHRCRCIRFGIDGRWWSTAIQMAVAAVSHNHAAIRLCRINQIRVSHDWFRLMIAKHTDTHTHDFVKSTEQPKLLDDCSDGTTDCARKWIPVSTNVSLIGFNRV